MPNVNRLVTSNVLSQQFLKNADQSVNVPANISVLHRSHVHRHATYPVYEDVSEF
ncbi:unnamed protein product [Enterobius vermicularis]|uniref:Uncharacterized protein n=1 Tax=Enterobius vermicularis TaxID=51028 RepID=A0A0N4V3G2_ENTVE|nr:unnamed protein product [Enterobius vermicularis]